jgi:hypothetical protein
MSKTLILRNFDELKAAMQAFVDEHKCQDDTWENHVYVGKRPIVVSDEDVFWFVAMREAESLTSCTLKDLGRALLEGTKPIDKEYVNDWCLSCIEDYDENDPDNEDYVFDFYANFCEWYNVPMKR